MIRLCPATRAAQTCSSRRPDQPSAPCYRCQHASAPPPPPRREQGWRSLQNGAQQVAKVLPLDTLRGGARTPAGQSCAALGRAHASQRLSPKPVRTPAAFPPPHRPGRTHLFAGSRSGQARLLALARLICGRTHSTAGFSLSRANTAQQLLCAWATRPRSAQAEFGTECAALRTWHPAAAPARRRAALHKQLLLLLRPRAGGSHSAA
jgi:hypothetical protein